VLHRALRRNALPLFSAAAITGACPSRFAAMERLV
jgi:hypothetical protein